MTAGTANTANTTFTVLTLAVNAAVALLLVSIAVPRARIEVRRRLGPHARQLALVVAVVTTGGSLYYSEIEEFIPCELCWYQRILMYPLVAVLGVGVLRGDRAVRGYATPFVALGAPLALYHWLVERVPALADSTSCSAFVPCTVPYFEELGYVTLAFMDLSAFVLIGALLLVDRAHDRAILRSPDATTPDVTKMEATP